ncbi:MAG: hypothetical protein HC912_08935 [Saprospiraceae bacterium]|nr:hypothetical protein [Saprospiraceae bacterium]
MSSYKIILPALLLGLMYQISYAQTTYPDWLQGRWQAKNTLMLMGMAFEEQIQMNLTTDTLTLYKVQKQGLVLSNARASKN